MISIEDFLRKVRVYILPDLINQEGRRRKMLIFLALMIIGVLFVLKKNLEKSWNNPDSTQMFEVPVFLIIFIISLVSFLYRAKIKKDILKKVFSIFGDIEIKEDLMSIKYIRDSYLFTSFNQYCPDDHIIGRYSDVEFDVQECQLYQNPSQSPLVFDGSAIEKVNRRLAGIGFLSALARFNKRMNISSVQSKDTKRVFRGVLISMTFEKNFNGHTNLMENRRFFKHSFPKKFEKTELEDVEFEKKFDVYTTDPVEARYILTPVFMESLKKLTSLYKGDDVKVAFFKQKVLIAIHTIKDMFEPISIFTKATDLKRFENIYLEIKSIYDMIDILNKRRKK